MVSLINGVKCLELLALGGKIPGDVVNETHSRLGGKEHQQGKMLGSSPSKVPDAGNRVVRSTYLTGGGLLLSFQEAGSCVRYFWSYFGFSGLLVWPYFQLSVTF